MEDTLTRAKPVRKMQAILRILLGRAYRKLKKVHSVPLPDHDQIEVLVAWNKEQHDAGLEAEIPYAATTRALWALMTEDVGMNYVIAIRRSLSFKPIIRVKIKCDYDWSCEDLWVMYQIANRLQDK